MGNFRLPARARLAGLKASDTMAKFLRVGSANGIPISIATPPGTRMQTCCLATINYFVRQNIPLEGCLRALQSQWPLHWKCLFSYESGLGQHVEGSRDSGTVCPELTFWGKGHWDLRPNSLFILYNKYWKFEWWSCFEGVEQAGNNYDASLIYRILKSLLPQNNAFFIAMASVIMDATDNPDCQGLREQWYYLRFFVRRTMPPTDVF